MGVTKKKIKDIEKDEAEKQRNAHKKEVLDLRGNKGTLDAIVEEPVRSPEELYERFSIDPEIWTIKRMICNVWEVGAKLGAGSTERMEVTPLHQIKAYLERRVDLINAKLDRDVMLDLMKKNAGKVPQLKIKKRTGEQHLAVPAIFDVHLGKLAWGPEVGGEDYDVNIAMARVKKASEYLLSRCKGDKIERVMIPIGNDFFNADQQIMGKAAATTAGTFMDEDGRWPRTFTYGRELLVYTIDLFSSIAPVDVKVIPGNHDETKMFYLGDSLECYYWNNKRVNVDNSPILRKYYSYGEGIFGLTHGKEEKLKNLPGLMSIEHPGWSEARWRDWLIGHFHHLQDRQYMPTDELDGCMIRFMASLSGTDLWHHKKGFVGAMKQCQLLTYHSYRGNTGAYPWRPGQND